MSKEIKAINPGAHIEGNKNSPRSGAFEIMVNEKLVYSRFETHSFPSKSEIKGLIND